MLYCQPHKLQLREHLGPQPLHRRAELSYICLSGRSEPLSTAIPALCRCSVSQVPLHFDAKSSKLLTTISHKRCPSFVPRKLLRSCREGKRPMGDARGHSVKRSLPSPARRLAKSRTGVRSTSAWLSAHLLPCWTSRPAGMPDSFSLHPPNRGNASI